MELFYGFGCSMQEIVNPHKVTNPFSARVAVVECGCVTRCAIAGLHIASVAELKNHM